MGEFQAKFTDDGSVGLYSKEVNDIYHSKFGALSEAYEKFIFPAKFDEFIKTHNKIKVLDICFGIGYNSKAFLNFYFQKLHEKNKCIKSIDTNNIFDVKNSEILLHGVEIDKSLIKLSPLIKQNKKIKNLYNNNNNNNNNNNLFSCSATNENKLADNKFYIPEEINIILLKKIIEMYGKNYFDDDVIKILGDKTNKKYFSQNLAHFIKNYYPEGYKLSHIEYILVFLHNIYYKYISNSYKNSLKVLENRNFYFELFQADARAFIKSSNIEYDFVFLDAFSPSKVPTLWTVEFFNELYKHTSENCMILTYSNSASIRNAFLQNNFYVGKIYNKYENRFTGTIATKNINLLEYHLDDFDLGLIKTKAGISYHDNKDLTLTNNEILENRKLEVENSNLISATQYKKEKSNDL